jgi:O-acetyl-ADP-ribose deacetylase (regulator of RNase III)
MSTIVDDDQGERTDRSGWEPIGRFRRWRWRRTEARRARELKGYRLPVQVCPRGCEFVEAARRDLLTRTGWSGRVTMQTEFVFETANCPKCGARLQPECPRCKEPIYAPVADRCEFCGLLQSWASERRLGVERRSTRRWRPGETGANDPAELLYAGKRGDLWVIEGDIATLEVDAVVSNDDVDGGMWAEVARAIKLAAGEEIEQLAQEETPYSLGQAWFTEAGNLPMRGIIHVAAMGRHGEQDLNTVLTCLTAALNLAIKKDLGSLGIAAFGSGPRTIEPDKWLRAFADMMVKYLSEETVPIDDRPVRHLSVVLVLFEPVDFDQALTTLEGAVRDAQDKVGRKETAGSAPSVDPAPSRSG